MIRLSPEKIIVLEKLSLVGLKHDLLKRLDKTGQSHHRVIIEGEARQAHLEVLALLVLVDPDPRGVGIDSIAKAHEKAAPAA